MNVLAKINLILVAVFMLSFAPSEVLQPSDIRAPLIVENWEGDGTFKEISYQQSNNDDDIADITEVEGNSAINGARSLRMKWRIKNGEYFYWGVDLRQGSTDGLDVGEAQFLSFKVVLETGKEKFEIKIKDTNGINPGISSRSFLDQNTSIQTVKVPLARFGNRVDLYSLENISLDFDRSTAIKAGSIIIDDVQFEFE